MLESEKARVDVFKQRQVLIDELTDSFAKMKW
jgi:hypothetical protein